uniref:Guanylate cyclase n=1 Tax=Angiostrongylus cantonensis TaxID=6313 RepID=A0A0K0CXY5_ANGCA
MINENGTRDPIYTVYGFDKSYAQVAFINFTITNGTPVKMDKKHFITNYRPLSRPICGYSGTECPKSFWDEANLAFFRSKWMIKFFYRMRRQEEEQQRLLWQIPYLKLMKPSDTKESKRSLQSGPSVTTGDSRFSSQDNFEPYEVYFLDKESVLTIKYPITALTREDYLNFSKLRNLQQESLHRFLGLSIDGPEYVTIWRLCSRGTLQKIIFRGSLWFDPFFMFCIMRDIAQGLRFLHSSFIESHGRLSSECCLVNESWQVMLSDYGTSSLQEENHRKKKRFLWTAPELLRGSAGDTPTCSKAGDIYSYAIISSEVITRKPPWNYQEREESLDELLYMIKRGGHAPIRPDLSTDGEINSALLHLIRDCWSERASERPTADTICKLLQTMNSEKKSNLMDHMFTMLEDYTNTLELDVEERTKELQEEKKKADILLRKMLPSQVADRLMLGQTVESESFDCVTVFFSDVVKFTQLSAKCSAYQTVNLLNDLYSGFDSIIEEHCVYKVESIGDGYLCVSGLPLRNGHNHIKEIAELSLSFMEFVNDFRIASLPKERIQLRIGVNSGPCVAGVVGLSMPRYCLFGDTVNTASRMESNGKGERIVLVTKCQALIKECHSGSCEPTLSVKDNCKKKLHFTCYILLANL